MQNPYRALSKINPQKEGHHREIANDVFDALISARLSGGEYQVVLSIIERTWGHQSLSRTISLGHFEKATNLSRQGVVEAVHSLEKKRIIAAQRNGTKGTEYLFNKHYDTWLPASQPQPRLVKEGLLAGDKALVNQSLLVSQAELTSTSQAELASTSQVPEASRSFPIESNRNNIESIIEKEPPSSKEEGDGKPSDSLAAQTPASKYLFEKTKRKRWANLVQKEQFEATEAEVGEKRMKQAIDWALTSGISNIKSIITAAKKGGRDGKLQRPDEGRGLPPDQRGSGRRDQAPTREEYLRSLKK